MSEAHLAPEEKRSMLTVDEKEVIRRGYFLRRKSMRQIAGRGITAETRFARPSMTLGYRVTSEVNLGPK
jgi:hypothetical protein